MEVVQESPVLGPLFEAAAPVLGPDLEAYRNHAYRVFNVARVLAAPTPEGEEKLALAAHFHDLGIWTDHTFDYLAPSAGRARAYLEETGREAWGPEITAMITEHHKITSAAHGGPLVEAFRRADWVDVSLGTISFGVPRSFLRELRAAFPNRGFHRRLISLTLERVRHHPMSPLPMFKW